MASITEWLISKAPPRMIWNDWGQRFVVVIGSLLDMVADGQTSATRCRFVSDAPSDALPYMGRDRLLDRGPDEADESWRARLDAAWDSWLHAGSVNPLGMIGQFVAWGFTDGTDVPILLESQDVSVPSRASYWSRFWVVVPPTCHSYTTTVPDTDAAVVRNMVRAFRPGNVICGAVIFVVTGRLWDWNMPATWDAWTASGDTWATSQSIEVT